MRAFLLFFNLLLQPLFASAQDYQPFLTPGKTWDVIYADEDGTIHPDYGVRYYLDGDTSWGGQTLWRLAGRRFEVANIFWPAWVLQAPHGYGWLREDTAARQVFFRDAAGAPFFEERKIYDFGLEPGDSIAYYWQNFHLDSIGWTTLTNGEQRRIFHFSPEGFWPNFYIEGIGGANDLVLALDVQFEHLGVLECVKQEGEPLYTKGYWYENLCDLVVATGQPPVLAAGKAFPNPARKAVRIELSDAGGATVRLLEIHSGKIVRQEQWETGAPACQIELGRLPAGIYLVEIWRETTLARFPVVKME